MSDSTPRLGLPDLPDTPELYADTVADAFGRIDAFTDLCLKGQFVNTPPSSPADGDAWLTGGAPTGAWSGYAYKIATCRDGGWVMLTPFDGLRAFVEGSNAFIVYCGGAWTDWNALISAAEVSIASAATCDLGAAGSLFMAVTGTTTITALGSAANLLRFVRFAGALTLTHNATSLILPGGASIVTAAGDTAVFASDGSGNWRCRGYSRADGRMVNMAGPVFSANLGIGMTPVNVLDITQNQNLPSIVKLLNNSSGSSAYGEFLVSNGTHVVSLQMNGTGKSPYGAQGTGEGGLYCDNNLWIQSDGGAVKIGAGSGGNQVAHFGASGAFINTGSSWASAQMEVAGSANVMSAYNAGASGAAYVGRVDATTSHFADFFYATGNVGSITTDGSGTTYHTVSDARLKTVSPRQGDYRAAIAALWVGDFTWTDSGVAGFGVLAQQAFDVMPNHQGVTRPAEEAGMWQASAEPFAHLALWGVKDLYALIETLRRRVAALEAAHDAG